MHLTSFLRSFRFRSLVRGFTMVELAAVISIMGILSGIAIMTYMGHIKNVQNRAAQQALQAVADDVRALTVPNLGFFPPLVITGAGAWSVIPYTLQSGPSTSPTQVSAAPRGSASTQMLYAAYADSGVCWVVLDDLVDARRFGALTVNAAACDATSINAALVVAGSFADV